MQDANLSAMMWTITKRIDGESQNKNFAAVYGFDQRFWRQRGLDVLGGVC